MRNFKKIVLAVVILTVFELTLSFLLEPVGYGYYLDVDLKRMEKAGGSPELIFAGDSRIYRTFIPSVFENGMEDVENAVNIGTGSQSVKGSYFYLKDMIKRYHPKYVVMGIDPICFMDEGGYITQGELTVIDRIKSPFIRAESIYSLLERKDYPYLLKSYRYRENTGDILSHIKDKFDKDVRRGIDKRPEEHYSDKGFVYTNSGFEEGNTGLPEPFPIQWKDTERKQEAFEYLDKIVSMCLENDAELFLVTGPTTLSVIYSIENYQEFLDCFEDYALQKGIPYQDMNMLKGRKTILPDTAMYDSDHVNGRGAEITSNFYCEILIKNIKGEDTSGYFYPSIKEMMQDIHSVVACDFHTEELENGDYRILASAICAPDETPEYEFLLSEDEGKSWKVLRAYGESNECNIPAGYLQEEVLLRVNSRRKGSSAAFEAYENKYKSVRLK